MKFSINRPAFINHLNDVSRAISTRTTIPVLTGLKMDVLDDRLILTGSDADISIEAVLLKNDESLDLQIESTGAIVLPARFFNEIIKKLPEKTVTIEITSGLQTKITSGSASFTINGLDALTYPHLPEIEAKEAIMLPARTLREIINQTVIAVSNQESRPILTGVHFVLKDNLLTVVATDSHRLAQRQVAVQLPEGKQSDVIIPGKSLLELSRMITEQLETIELRIAENQVLFKVGQNAFYSRLLEGNYPDTTRLIPDTADTTVEFLAPNLLASIERASLLSHESRNNVVKLALTVATKTVTISGNSPDVGTVEEEIQNENLAGTALEISFNPDYMKDALRSFGNVEIKLAFTSPLRPFTIVPTANDENFIQLITPVRTY